MPYTSGTTQQNKFQRRRPVVWPARSLDLTLPSFRPWRHLVAKGYAQWLCAVRRRNTTGSMTADCTPHRRFCIYHSVRYQSIALYCTYRPVPILRILILSTQYICDLCYNKELFWYMYLQCIATPGPCNWDDAFSVTHEINFFLASVKSCEKP